VRYEFKCDKCQGRKLVVMPASQRDAFIEPECCGSRMEQTYESYGYAFSMGEAGKRTGIYEYDYGKKATWDLTPPGKMDALKKAGVLRDPFDKAMA
jgi:predicted nucleic acid-binding Zn ribbon protein